MRQRCNVGGSFGGRRVAAVALVVVLAMALVEQWQRWVRQQSNKKNNQLTMGASKVGGGWQESIDDHTTTMAGNNE
jgi:hypothetical protein